MKLKETLECLQLWNLEKMIRFSLLAKGFGFSGISDISSIVGAWWMVHLLGGCYCRGIFLPFSLCFSSLLRFFGFSSLFFSLFFVFLSVYFVVVLRFSFLFSYFSRILLEDKGNDCNLLQKLGISLRPRLHRPCAELPESF